MADLTDEHRALGVDFDGERYTAKGYRYTTLEDAVNYARSQTGGAAKPQTGAAAKPQTAAADRSQTGVPTAAQREIKAKAVVLTTAFTTVAGDVTEEIDVITSECVFGINLFKDFLGGVRDIVGGRAGAHQKVLKDLRKTCLDELRMNAAELGADAVIGVDLGYSEISGKNGGLLMLVASGTAVKLEPKE